MGSKHDDSFQACLRRTGRCRRSDVHDLTSRGRSDIGGVGGRGGRVPFPEAAEQRAARRGEPPVEGEIGMVRVRRRAACEQGLDLPGKSVRLDAIPRVLPTGEQGAGGDGRVAGGV